MTATTTAPAARPRALTFGNMWLSAALIAVIVLYPMFFGKAMNFGVSTLIFAGLAMSWNILGGWAGQTSLGHAALLGIGAYTMTLLAIPERVPAIFGGPVAPWWGALIAMVLAALIAAVWGGLTFRLRGSYFTLSSIAVALVIRLIAINSEWTGGSEGLFMPDLPRFLGLDLFDRKAEYILAAAFVVLTLGITHAIRRSRLGYALQAVREDEDGARALGIDPTRMKVIAFMISAALTALGGALYGIYLQAFEPHTLLELPISVQIALMAIIGGRGTIQGPAIGAILLAVFGEIFRNVFANANLLIYGVLILVVTLFAPNGVMGLFQRGGRKLGTAR
ncbi:branched-chain amino acid transport system permease protein [Deinococcus metalli]|uniref:Branched-chain amino acid ABC transporter permease n=1 Tax=Deinococcus metalli TaxID=1141878 RepID=A0A7W8KBX8_9DEIO|nr:branched-chain amino acid ABC transporter permease [Deinococcus metalli]MBB5375357.1 branched-chain amino acid transport system permease protein [Deinococcus metalli]GHF29903.1 branched-chain amino acid ABC transporter permease [Deinococcus metalli]